MQALSISLYFAHTQTEREAKAMYKTMLKNQTTFFTFAADALAFFKGRFHVSTNDHGLHVLKLDDKVVASFKPEEKDDAILYYANRQVMREAV